MIGHVIGTHGPFAVFGAYHGGLSYGNVPILAGVACGVAGLTGLIAFVV